MNFTEGLNQNKEIVKLEPTALLEFFTIDTSKVINDPFFNFQAIKYNFHPYSIRQEDSNGATEDEKQRGALVWRGTPYYYYPIAASGFEITGNGGLPRPIIRISNIFPEIKDLTLNLGDLAGAQVTRKRVFRKYLDGENEESFGTHFEDEVYIISRKKTENKLYIEFELVTIAEANNIKLPRRVITQNSCGWRYRADGCGWGRAKIIDINNVLYGVADNEQGDQNLPDPIPWELGANYTSPTVVYHEVKGNRYYYLCKTAHTATYVNRFDRSLWIVDECAKSLKACRCRWITSISPNETLPFGAFPAIDRAVP